MVLTDLGLILAICFPHFHPIFAAAAAVLGLYTSLKPICFLLALSLDNPYTSAATSDSKAGQVLFNPH